jgi:hypothetical protein
MAERLVTLPAKQVACQQLLRQRPWNDYLLYIFYLRGNQSPKKQIFIAILPNNATHSCIMSPSHHLFVLCNHVLCLVLYSMHSPSMQ